ncbi:hypothetical protein BELL_0164g00130 [Botrytis elliptica]|uniref:Uncharacterized protein n=1 Tax=Botrytis elliptica TaxID=278938 RepID=A0A4Z1JSP7_9HELO|nr:hypothetical protein EAE99_009457 [Botrytis elliptica]TGO76284.1 hypothetical protein BELL_0164g00130 [Botrytis elliptica]
MNHSNNSSSDESEEDLPLPINETYKARPLHQIMALQTLRPYPGACLSKEDLPPGGKHLSLRDLRAQFNTRAIDVMLILLRHLRSFGYAIEDLEQNQVPTKAERVLIDASNLNLGWYKHQDWTLKLQIIKVIADGTVDQSSSWTFDYLQSHPQLSNLFHRNRGFTLALGEVIIEDSHSGDFEIHDISGKSLLSLINEPSFQSSSLINRQMMKLLEIPFSNRSGVHLCRIPKFYRVRYHVAEDQGRPISDLRMLEFDIHTWKDARKIPEKIDLQDFQRQKVFYQLISVIRLAQGGETNPLDMIRTYLSDGCEVVPARIGTYQLKEPEIDQGQAPWSVEEKGTYMLFYCHVLNATDSNLRPLNDEPEFVSREWALDVESR